MKSLVLLMYAKPNIKLNFKKAGSVTQAIECLASKNETLGSNLSIRKKFSFLP
jgi:hypothetical protein